MRSFRRMSMPIRWALAVSLFLSIAVTGIWMVRFMWANFRVINVISNVQDDK